MNALIARLRAEQGARTERTLQAVLLHECGVLAEAQGEEPVAARDFLAAFNSDPQFREPLEALVRILTRRKSIKNLGKLLDALTRAAATPEERARAHWERAAFQADHENNLAAAKESLQEAIGENPEDPTAWLALELIAAKQGDAAESMRAIEARAELSTDSTWKGLLLLELSDLAARSGDVERAYALLDTAGALDGHAQFRTRLALERIASRAGSTEVVARALEGQAELIAEALDDPSAGDATGVPRFVRKPENAADAWLRAAELKRRVGDRSGWLALLKRSAERLPDSAIVARAWIAALESSGDSTGAAVAAKAELDRGAKGPAAAPLWLRLADAASVASDSAGAVAALRGAIAADPGCIPARVLEIDLLGEGEDAAALAGAVEASTELLPTEGAKARAFLLSAYVWACRANDAAAAKVALSQAAASGLPASAVNRVARTLAALRGDTAWYEDATRRLLGADLDSEAAQSLWFELGRSRLLRQDGAGAGEAFEKLASIAEERGEPAAAWLGHVLGAYALAWAAEAREAGEDGGDARAARKASAGSLERLAGVEQDADLARGLRVAAALRATRDGDLAHAAFLLAPLHESAPGDVVAAVFLAELRRRAGDGEGAGAALVACASAVRDAELAASLSLEAGLLFWRAGDRPRAIAAFESARAGASRAASAILGWALRGASADSLEGRRRAIEAASEAGGDPVALALERAGLELSWPGGGDRDAAVAALSIVEREGAGELAVAGALARLVAPAPLDARPAVERALERLDELGGDARAVARAEKHRLARAVDQSPALALEAAAAWAEAEPRLAPALEWLVAALATGDRAAEIEARRAAARCFEGAAREAMEASAAIVAALDRPSVPPPPVSGESPATVLANVEIAPPGSDPRRRSAALRALDGALGDDASLDALALAGWSDLAAGANDQALAAFRVVVDRRPDDLAAWEGLRSAADAVGDPLTFGLAAARIGGLCQDDPRAAEFWEAAGLRLLEQTDAHDDAEIALSQAFERDPRRGVAFDKLFRRVRARNEDDRLLEIAAKRLEVTEDEAEIGKMHWERARVLRRKGNRDGALEALENVTMLEPDHVGALALAGEIQISKGAFDKAAPLLARLSTIAEAPQQQRLLSGVAAVDLYENKLGNLDKALEILLGLHRAGLATPPVRERLARVAARAGAWGDATQILEQLMHERQQREGRVEAARLAMAIWRDKLGDPLRAQPAVEKLLDETLDDAEAADLVLTTGYDPSFRARMLGRAKGALVHALGQTPTDADRVALLAKIAGAGQDVALRQAALGALVALGRDDPGVSDELARIDSRIPARPQIVLDGAALAEIADPLDQGPLPALFVAMAETLSAALGPSLASVGVTKKDRIDPRGGHALRVAVAEWMGALGFTGDFDVYVGGSDPRAVTGIAGEVPAIVLGAAVKPPLDVVARSALAREAFALRRGITAVRARDDGTIVSVVVAACNEAGVAVTPPPYALYTEVSRAVHKEIPRKVRRAILEVCQATLASGQDAREWAAAARRSLDRMAVIAAGDVSIVLADVLGAPREQLGALVSESERARRLLAFVLSPSYLELRKKLGMGAR